MRQKNRRVQDALAGRRSLECRENFYSMGTTYLSVKDLLKEGLTRYQAEQVIKRANEELRRDGKMTFKGKAPWKKIEEVLGCELLSR